MTLVTWTSATERDAAIVERRRDGASLEEIGAEFGLCASRVSRIVRALIPVDERKRIERTRRSQAQDARHGPLRNELLANLAPCGCPACSDPACDVPRGYCHHCRVKPVNYAEQAHRGERKVADYPLMFCSRSCRGHASKGDLRDTAQALLATVGGCGSPSCTDPDCTIPAGQCHRDGCANPARAPWGTDERIRSVRGYPLRHCSKRCERLDNEQVVAAAAARLTEREHELREIMRRQWRLVPTSKAARLLGVTPRQAQRRLGGELIVFDGVARRAFGAEEVKRAAADKRAAGSALNVEIASGSAGRMLELTDEQMARIRTLVIEGGPKSSIRAMARLLGCPQVRVERLLAREKLSRKS